MSSTARLERLIDELSRGHALQLVAIGGSSTAGHQFARSSPVLYHSQLLRWFKERFPAPRAPHYLVNAGTPATGPQYTDKCFALRLLLPFSSLPSAPAPMRAASRQSSQSLPSAKAPSETSQVRLGAGWTHAGSHHYEKSCRRAP
jgi:hypothetical protein